MKKTAAFLSIVLILGTFSGCGNSDSSAENVTSTTTVTTTSAATAAPAESSTTTTAATTTEAATSAPEEIETTTATTTASESDTQIETEKQSETTTKAQTTRTTTKPSAAATTTAKATTKATTTAKSATKATTTTKATTKATITTKATTKAPEPAARRVVLPVKNIQMLPELPKGAEITSAAMVLNYLGIKCDKMDLLKYLPMSKRPANHNIVWVAPQEYFCGDPRETVDSFGCLAYVIVKTVNDYFSANNITNYVAEKSDQSFTDLVAEISKGNPVIIWTTINMEDINNAIFWSIANGGTITWPLNEHCVVLMGYDSEKNTLIVNDPLSGIVEYPQRTVKEAYWNVFDQAVVIRKK